MLFKLANLIMGGAKFLGETTTPNYTEGAQYISEKVTAIVNAVLIPVLGINFARADSNEKREEAKKRLISLIVGIVVVIALMFFFLFGFKPLLEAFGINGTPATDWAKTE